MFSQTVAPVSPYATQLIILIGLAVSVDYSLFMITRFRSERRHGRDKLDAIEIASAHGRPGRVLQRPRGDDRAGRAVHHRRVDFRSMAIGTIGVVFVAVVGSLTFLPATLAILGDGVNRGRIPFFGREREEGSGLWSRLVGGVMRRPVPLALGAIVVLLLLASPAIHLRIGITDITSFPEKIDGVQAIKTLYAKWPQGSTENLQVAVTDFDNPATQAAVDRVPDGGGPIPGLSDPKVTPSRDGKVALVSFTIAGAGQNDPASQAIVSQVRSTTVPAAFGALSGVRAYVTGQAAQALDVTRIYVDAIPAVFAFVLGLSFLLLLVVFHSIVIPVKAILLNLLSTAAAYGVVVAVFQDNILGGRSGSSHPASSRAGSRSSSSRSCSACRWTTTCSS